MVIADLDLQDFADVENQLSLLSGSKSLNPVNPNLISNFKYRIS